MLDAFHVVALGGHAVDEVRRRVQQEIHGHRGRSGDPLYGIRNLLRCGAERLTDKQHARLAAAIAADERHDEVDVAWQCAQRLRDAYHHPDPVEGRQLAEQIVASFPTCPIPEIARLGRTLRQWRAAFLAYFDTGRASNGGSEAINGLIELHRRIARGFRNRENYRLRMLLIGGGLNVPPTTGVKSPFPPQHPDRCREARGVDQLDQLPTVAMRPHPAGGAAHHCRRPGLDLHPKPTLGPLNPGHVEAGQVDQQVATRAVAAVDTAARSRIRHR